MSAIHCVEVTKFAVSDTARAAGIALPPPSLLPTSTKDTRVCSGWEVQEPQYYYHFRAWDSTEDEHNPLLDEAAEAPVDMPQGCTQVYKIHAHLNCEPRTMIDAPLTEIVTWELKDHAKKEVVEELLTGLMNIVNAIPREAGIHKAQWGSVSGSKIQYVVMIGWDTMEEFYAAVAGSPDGRAQLDKLAEHTDRLVRHIPLQHIITSFEARL